MYAHHSIAVYLLILKKRIYYIPVVYRYIFFKSCNNVFVVFLMDFGSLFKFCFFLIERTRNFLSGLFFLLFFFFIFSDSLLFVFIFFFKIFVFLFFVVLFFLIFSQQRTWMCVCFFASRFF